MKALHLAAGNLFGGIEALLVTQARFAALEPGLRHEFAIGFPGRLEDELRAAGAVVRRYDGPRLSRPWAVLKARRQIARMLDASAPDVVVIHSNWTNLVVGRTARRRGLPVAYWLHDSYDPASRMTRMSSRFRPDLVVANSRFNAETALPLLFPGVPWEVNHSASPPRDVTDRDAARARVRAGLGTPDDSVVIAQISRLDRWKGQENLIAAGERMRGVAGWEFWIAGGTARPHEAQFRDELRARADASGIGDRVKFLGERPDIADVLAAADIHCQPNLSPEPLGLTFVEALYAALPNVSMRMGGAAEILTPECGILVEPGDIAALAEALTRLIGDPELRARLGAAGPARAHELSDPARHLARLKAILGRIARPAAAAGGRR